MSLIKVKYVGVADVRKISKKEFASAGVVVDKDVSWNIKNRFSVVLDSNDRMEEVLRGEGHFTIKTMDDLGDEKVIATASDPEVEADTLVDATTGASTPSKKAKP